MSSKKIEVSDEEMRDLREALPDFSWKRNEYTVDGDTSCKGLVSRIYIYYDGDGGYGAGLSLYGRDECFNDSELSMHDTIGGSSIMENSPKSAALKCLDECYEVFSTILGNHKPKQKPKQNT